MRKGLFVILVSIAPAFAFAQDTEAVDTEIRAHVTKPPMLPASLAFQTSLKVPPGFSVKPFAQGLKNVRILTLGSNGAIYASRREQGDVLLLRDANDDGKADGEPAVVARIPGSHGLAYRDGVLYIVTVKELFAARSKPDGTLETPQLLLGDLPDSGQHPNRTLAFGADGMLYVSVGSTCNACNESNPENATLLRVSPDGKSRTIFASGLRNTIGFDWNPATGKLWGMDHGIDYLGDDIQPEELNRIEQGKQYGWPHIWGSDGVNPQSTPVGGLTKAQWKSMSVPMVAGYTAHAAPMQMAFYRGNQFPNEYRGDAFVAMHGSWNRAQPSGYEVVRVRFKNGEPTFVEPFLTGFIRADGYFGRPVGLLFLDDGSMLVGDDANGVLYRVTHEGARTGRSANSSETRQVSAPPMPTPKPVRLASADLGTTAVKTLKVSSTSFSTGAEIPPRHTEYYDGISPALSWPAVAGAKSYAIVMEDPDSKPITPFIHWIVWNIPPNSNSLPEGVPEQPRLTEPDGVLQGQTSRGSIGYFGPRPPVPDGPHHYHFEVYALDTLLDLAPGATRDEFVSKAKGRVLAYGELVGTYDQKIAPLK